MPSDSLLSDQSQDRLRAEQVAALYRNATPGTIGSLIAASILAGLLLWIGSTSPLRAFGFLGCLTVFSIGRLMLVRAYKTAAPPVEAWRRWAHRAVVSTVLTGLCWGIGSLLLMNDARPEYQLMVLLTSSGLVAGAITAFGTYLPAYYGNLFTIMLPTVVWGAFYGDALHATYAVLALLWVIVIAVLARTFNRILSESLRLQFDNLKLATEAVHQKELAEQANVAKSRFLASASHDLRQPVHALGLFVGALRDRRMDKETGQLVNQIDASVTALDGLFTSLLDISQLDAGIVQVDVRPFPIQSLLERICREQAPEAERKGVDLILMPCSQWTRSDPILLERILRNLVSNAIRYTEKGRVLIGCRRGSALSVEIWDTGCGIPADQIDLVFQEFYQIGNPERDRTRGIGLGLAIVKRLTEMLGIELALRSTSGRGTVARLTLANAPPERLMPEADAALPPSAPTPRSIVIIDDETAIQEAMRTLLTAWGHCVIIAGSGEEALRLINDNAMRPDLVISDYRLRDGENGISTIERLRSALDTNMPAILITGDTAPDRIREANSSRCFLMHKPVPNGKLRAAITNLTIDRGLMS